MAVFTQVSTSDLTAWLELNTSLSLAGDLEPVAEGIENTNFFFTADDDRRYVFTVFEVWERERAEYCVALTAHLNQHDQPVPAPVPLKQGRPCALFDGKPAVAVEFRAGNSIRQPESNACATIGEALAGLHLAAANFRLNIPNARGNAWRAKTAANLSDKLSRAELSLLEHGLKADAACAAAGLPQAACHCDLFRNNVLWKNSSGEISAVIDFYFAGHDWLLFDLAVTAVDWCFDDQGKLDEAKLRALATGYAKKRKLHRCEIDMLPQMFAVAALRFWISRLDDMHNPRPACQLVAHNPDAFRCRLASCLDHRQDISIAFA